MPAALWCLYGCSGALAAMWMCGGKVGRRPIETRAPVVGAGTKGIELSNVIQAQSGRRGDEPHIRPKLRKPPLELRRCIKRLLKLDRSIGRNLRSKDAEEANFAFFSE